MGVAPSFIVNVTSDGDQGHMLLNWTDFRPSMELITYPVKCRMQLHNHSQTCGPVAHTSMMPKQFDFDIFAI